MSWNDPMDPKSFSVMLVDSDQAVECQPPTEMSDFHLHQKVTIYISVATEIYRRSSLPSSFDLAKKS